MVRTMIGILGSRAAMEGRRFRLGRRHAAYAGVAQLLMRSTASVDSPTEKQGKKQDKKQKDRAVLMAFGSAFKGRGRRRGMKHGAPVKGIRSALAKVGPVVDGPEFFSSRVCGSCGAFVSHPTHQQAVCGFCGARTPRDETAGANILLTTMYQMFFRLRVPTMTPDIKHTKWKYFGNG